MADADIPDFYYVDPYSEQLSENPATKWELKELWTSGRLNKTTYIWNEHYEDYITIEDVPELLYFLQSAATVNADEQEDFGAKAQRGQESPENWAEYQTEEGRSYYHNIVTNEITWEKPDCLKTEDELGRAGDWRWIPHDVEGFVKAKLISTKKNGSMVFADEANNEYTISKNSETYTVLWAILSRSTADLVMLDSLDPPIILHNLKKRFQNNEIYTKIGNILISVNPYKMLPLYTPTVLEEYINLDNKHLAPHVYEIARNAFQAMLDTNVSQSVIISGESGAGKTECTKQCLQYIAESAGSKNNVEQKLLSTNPILETFGNAKTVRNNNSSRFGKYIEIYFDITGSIVAATNTNYLLEKIRVIQCDDNERNYHAFYQLVKAAPDEMRQEYSLGQCEDYNYLQGLTDAPGIDDAEEFAALVESMANIGMSEKESKSIFQLTAALLWLGNITFESQEAGTGVTQKSCIVPEGPAMQALATCCGLLQLDIESVKEALTHKVFSIGNRAGHTLIGLSDEEASVNRDSLAKFIYDRQFDWIVKRLNDALIDPEYKTLSNFRHIGILDIFGFEIFKHNSFEQLCINFTNEKLQQHFDMNTFKLEEELYRSEGIKFDHVNYVDNQPVLDLIEKKKTGLMYVLDAQMKMPKADDKTFLIALNQHQAKNKAYYKPYVKKQGHFVINHYAGEVIYDAEGFMDKNRDSLNANLVTLMGKSKFEFIQTLFPDATDSNKARKISLGAQFRAQLNALMETLNETEPHYIRCIKPNTQKVPDQIQGHMVLEQLVYSGVFEAVKIRKSGYPFRRTHKEFVNRYCCIDRNKNWNTKDPKQAAKEVIEYLDKELGCDLTTMQVGNSMVLYRADDHNTMELRRNLALDEVVRFIQNNIRRWQDIGLFAQMKRVKPILEAAIKKRTIEALDAAIGESVNIDYDMKLIRDCKDLKQVILQEIALTKEIEDLLKVEDSESVVDDVRRKLLEAENLNLDNEATQAARELVAKFQARIDARNMIEECLKLYEPELMQAALELADLAEIPETDPDIVKVKAALKHIEDEAKFTSQIEEAMPQGAWLQPNDDVSTQGLETLLHKCADFTFRTAKGKFLIELMKRLITLRVAIKAALATENDDAWNQLRTVIDTIVTEEESMKDHTEIVAINKQIYEHFNNNKVSKLQESLQKALNDMEVNNITLQLNEADQLGITAKDLPLIEAAQQVCNEINEVRRLLTTGMKTCNLGALKQGIEQALGMGYNRPIVHECQEFYMRYGTFIQKLAIALEQINVDMMKELMEEVNQYKYESEAIEKMKEYLYKMPEERLLALQLNAAVSSRDPSKVCAITMRLKELFFAKAGDKFEWNKYGKLLTPAAWAKTSSWPFGRDKLEKGFYDFTVVPIHHPLTDLRAANQMHVVGKGGPAVSKVSFLKKESVQMFKNIMGYMGDRNYTQPLILVRDILKKCMTYSSLRPECLSQILKQLTNNPKRTSEEKGWALLGVMLDTFSPPKDVENFLEVWLRTHAPPHMEDKDYYVRLMHQTVYQGSRTKVPTLSEIEDLLKGRIRTFDPNASAAATPVPEIKPLAAPGMSLEGNKAPPRPGAGRPSPPRPPPGGPGAHPPVPPPPGPMDAEDFKNDEQEQKIQLPSLPLKDTTEQRPKKMGRNKRRTLKKLEAPTLSDAQKNNIDQQRQQLTQNAQQRHSLLKLQHTNSNASGGRNSGLYNNSALPGPSGQIAPGLLGKLPLPSSMANNWIPPPPPPENDMPPPAFGHVPAQSSMGHFLVRQQSSYAAVADVDMTGWTDQQKEWHRQWQEYNRQQQAMQQQAVLIQRASTHNMFGAGMFNQGAIPPPPGDEGPPSIEVGPPGAPQLNNAFSSEPPKSPPPVPGGAFLPESKTDDATE